MTAFIDGSCHKHLKIGDICEECEIVVGEVHDPLTQKVKKKVKTKPTTKPKKNK